MKHYTLAARGVAGIMIVTLWGLFGSPLLGVLLVLALSTLTILRYRFAPYWWLGLAETGLCLLASFWWPPAILGLWLPVIGILESGLSKWEMSIHQEVNENRSKRLMLEEQQAQTIAQASKAAALAETAERERIAQDIHDHVGHEIAGALIALQTIEKLMERDQLEDARALLPQAVHRVRQASVHLRDTVHNLKPERMTDEQMLAELCAKFSFCPVQYTKTGDFSRLSAMQWQLFSSVLKEALTNIARHSSATQAMVRLDANMHHARLAIRDNGEVPGTMTMGMGLSGMRERASLAGGALTIQTSEGFQIICILPIGGNDEHIGRG